MLATTIAGSRQQSRLIALLDDYDRTLELEAVAMDSEGQADLQFSKYADTVEYRINQIQTKWEEFRQNLLNSQLFKDALDIVISFLDKLNDIDTGGIVAFFAAFVILGRKAIKQLSFEYSQLFNSKIKIPIIVDDREIISAEQRIDNLNNSTVTINADTSQLDQKLSQVEQKIRNLQGSLGSQNNGHSESYSTYTIPVNISDDGISTYNEGYYNGESYIVGYSDGMTESLSNSKKITSSISEATEDGAKNAESSAKKAGYSLGGIVATSLVTAMTATVFTDNPGQAMMSVVLTGVMQMIPILVQTVSAGAGQMAAAFTAAGGPVTLAITGITVALTGLAMLAKNLYKNFQAGKLSNRIDALSEKVDNLNSEIQETQSNLDDYSSQVDSLEEIQETYDDLRYKVILSEEEQEKFNSMIETLQSDYPELISYYNEETGELRLQNQLLDLKIEKTKELQKEEAQTLLGQQSRRINLEVQQGTLESIQNVGSAMSLSEERYGSYYSDADRFDDTVQRLITSNEALSASVIRSSNQNQSYSRKILISNPNTSFTVSENSILDFYNEHLLNNDQDELENTIDLTDEMIESVAKIYEYGYTQNEMLLSSLSETEKEAALELNAIIEQNRQALKEINNNFLDFYESIRSYYDEVFPDMSEEEKSVRSSITAGIQDQLNNPNLGITDAFNKITASNTTDFEKQINNATKEVSKNLPDFLKGTGIEDTLNDSQKKFKEAYDDITAGAWGVENDFNDLSKETRNLLESMGITTENYNEYFAEGQSDRASAEIMAELYTQHINQAITDAIADMPEDTFSEIINIQEELNVSGNEMTYDEYMKKVEETRNILSQFIKDEEQLNQTINQLTLEDELTQVQEQLSDLGINYSNMSVNAIQSLSRITAEIKDSFGILQGSAEQSINNFVGMIQNSELSSDIQNALLTFDPTDLEGSTKKNAIDTVKQLILSSDMTGKIGELEAEQYAEAFINGLENSALADFSITNYLGFKTVKDEIETELGEIVKSFDEITPFITDQISQGYIDAIDKLDLTESLNEMGLNIDDYIRVNENGDFQLLYEKLYEDSQGLLSNQDELEKQAKEQIQQGITQLEQQKAILSGLQGEEKLNWNIVDAARQVTKEYYTQAQLKAGTDAQSIQALQTAKTTLESMGYAFDDQGSIIDTPTTNFDDSQITEQINLINGQIEELKELSNSGDMVEAQAFINQMVRSMNEAVKEGEEAAKNNDEQTDALKDVNEAQENVIEAQEKLNDALEEYNELLYGSDNRSSSLDFLYNYTEPLDTFNSQIEDAKENLNETSSIDAAIDSWEEYGNAAHNALAQEQARQQVIQQGLDNYADMIENGTASYQNEETGETISINFGDYASYDTRTGKYQVDQALLNQTHFNDSYKDLIEEQIETYNNYVDEYETSRQNIEKIEKEFQEQIETANSNYAAMEDEIANVLKEKYQEEVDNLQEKYNAMKEADDDYLDALQEAIDKQRELRDRENDYEDLAQQERKLALMRRDTSGTTQTEVMELEDQISETRQDLLDSEVDSIINGMQDIYESQQELRDVEIELKSAIIDNTAYWNQQAASVAATFVTAEDYMAWMTENSTEFAESTITKQEVLMTEYYDIGAAAMQKYAMESIGTIENYLVVTAQEVQTLTNNTGQAFTEEVTRAFNETTMQVLEDLENAKEGIADAKTALDEANIALKEAVTNLNNLKATADEFNFEDHDSINSYYNEKRTSGSPIGISTNQSPNQQQGETMAQRVARIKATMNNQEIHQGIGSSQSIAMNSKEYSYILEIDGGALNGKYYASSDSIDLLKDFVSKSSVVEEWLRGEGQTALAGNWPYKIINDKNVVGSGIVAFEKGGLVNYTGPAWVDGTPSKPEAFLSAEDTQRIAQLTSVLSNIPLLNLTPNTENISSTSYGDTQIEINLNIDSLSSDIDVENMLDRMKQEIVDVATPIGTTNILRR